MYTNLIMTLFQNGIYYQVRIQYCGGCLHTLTDFKGKVQHYNVCVGSVSKV